MLVAPPQLLKKREAKTRKNQIINGLLNNYDKETLISDNVTIDDCIQAPIKDFKICGKEIKQETRQGYNQVDFSNPTNVPANTEFSFKNGSIKINATGSYKRVEWDILDLLKNNTGKILKFTCADIDYSQASAGVVQIRTTSAENQNTYNVLIKQNQNDKTYTIPDNISNITRAVLAIYSNDTSSDIESSITLTKPMLLFGIEDKPYEQFGQSPSKDHPSTLEYVEGNQEVEHINKNLFDKENQNMGYYSPDKIFHNSTVWYYREFKPIANANYTLSGILSTLSSGACVVGFKNNEIAIIQNGFSNINKFNSGSYDKIAYSVHKDNIDTAMLEFEDKNTSYVEHQSEIINLTNLPALYSKEDYIYYDEKLKKYFVHNNYDKIILTSDLVWSISNSGYWYYTEIKRLLANQGSNIYSNYFKKVKGWTLQAEESSIISGNNYIGLVGISSLTFDSIDDFKKFLDEHEVYAIAELAEPTDKEITSEILIKQLDKLREIFTHEGTNHFIVSAENGQSCNLEVTAYKNSIKIMQKEIDILKALVLEQEG